MIPEGSQVIEYCNTIGIDCGGVTGNFVIEHQEDELKITCDPSGINKYIHYQLSITCDPSGIVAHTTIPKDHLRPF